MTTRRFLPVLALSLLAGAPVAANADPFIVAGAVTIEGGTHTYAEQVIVLPGSTLTIKDATIYLDSPRSCPIGGTFQFCHPQLFVMPGGTLNALGTTFDTHRPVDPATDPASGYMVYAYSGVLNIENSTFLRQNVVGGELPGPARSIIRNNSFTGGVQAISLLRGMEGSIESNVIRGNRFGIDVRDSSSTIRYNIVEGVLGYGIDVQSTTVGDKPFTTRAVVTNNVVTDSLGGFFTLNGYGSTVRNNVFARNKYGAILGVNVGSAMIGAEPITFEGNLIEGAETALRSYVSGDQRTPRTVVVPIQGNSIIGTTCTEVRVTVPANANVTLSVDARGNWWGSASGPQSKGDECPATAGPVLVDPWLTEAPF